MQINGDECFQKQLAFIVEIDKIKQIVCKTRLFDGSRFENDAEHAWHLSIMGLMLAKYANEQVDLLKVIKMVVIHDVVEIDAGDTFVYDEKNRRDSRVKEDLAAQSMINNVFDNLG